MSDSPKIDLSRPIAFYDERNLPEDQRRPIHVVGTTREGNILIESQYKAPLGKWWDTPVAYKPNGYVLNGHGRICNVPKRDSGFYPIDALGPLANTRGMTVLSFVWDEYKLAQWAVEIKREDGIPVDVVLHARP